MSNKVFLMKHALKSVPGLPDVRAPQGVVMAPKLRPQVPDQKSTYTTLIRVKNWRTDIGQIPPKALDGRGAWSHKAFLK